MYVSKNNRLLCFSDDFDYFWQFGKQPGRIQRGATGPCSPPNHGWKIKTQLPRTHVRTAATINDHNTAHKHSSLAPFQTYDNTKKRSASGGLLPLDSAGGTAPRPHYRLALRSRHMAPSNLYSCIRPWPIAVALSSHGGAMQSQAEGAILGFFFTLKLHSGMNLATKDRFDLNLLLYRKVGQNSIYDY